MDELDRSFTATLYRPYFDLGVALPEGPLHPFGIEFDYLSLADGTQHPRLQGVLMPSYRDALIHQTGFLRYQLDHPLELAPELRTPRWQYLCDLLEQYQELSPLVKLKVLRLLGQLCLYQTILQLEADEIPLDAISREESAAEIAYLRALSYFVFSFESNTRAYHPTEMKRIATAAPEGSTARILALYQMVVQHVKYEHDIDAVEYWLPLYHQQIQQTQSRGDVFTYRCLISRYHRVAGFAPQMRRDKAGVLREMDLAEHYARSIPREDTFQCIVADEVLQATLESRTKEALWIGDLDLAEKRAYELVDLCPLDPTSHMELGQILLELDKVEEAAKEYRSAAMLGPRGTEVSYFMLGQCYEALDQLEMAREAYLSSLKIDPLAISAAERLSFVAEKLGDAVIARWSHAVWTSLQEDEEREEERAYQKIPPPLPQ